MSMIRTPGFWALLGEDPAKTGPDASRPCCCPTGRSRRRGLDVLVAAHRLVALKLRHEAGDGRRHTQSGIGIDVVGTHAATKPLDGRVPVEHRPLPGAIHPYRPRTVRVERLLKLRSDQVKRLVPGDLSPAVAFAQHRLGQTIFAVQHRRQVIPLDAEQAPIYRTRLIAAHRHDPALGDTHLNAATGAAVAAGRLVPVQVSVGDSGLAVGNLASSLLIRARERRDARGPNPQRLEKISSFHRSSSLSRVVPTGLRGRSVPALPAGCARTEPRHLPRTRRAPDARGCR